MSATATATAAALPVAVALAAGAGAVLRSRSRSGPQQRFWRLLGPAAAAWAAATATGVLAQTVGAGSAQAHAVLGAATLVGVVAWAATGISAVGSLSLAYQTRATLTRDVLDTFLLVMAGLSLVWSAVLEPLWGSQDDALALWTVAAAMMLAVDLIATAAHAAVRSPEQEGSVRLVLVGLAAVCAGDVVSGRSYLVTGRSPDPAALALWGLGWGLVLTAVLLHRRRPQQPERCSMPGRHALPLAAAGVIVAVTAHGVVSTGGRTDPVTFWLSTAALLGAVCRTLVELRTTSRLQRALAHKVEERTRALADSRHRFEALVAHSSDLVVVIDEARRTSYANPGAARLLGVPHGAAAGGLAAEHLLHGEDSTSALAVVRSMVANRVEHLSLRLALRHADGSRVDVDAVVTNLLDDPDVQGLVVNARDVTEALRLERQLSEQAFSDPLTGLPNRALFRDRLEQALLSRASHGPVKVMYLDLDGFKTVNDTLGHDTGDELLVAVAERLRTTLRQGDTVARLGGDEFAVLLDEGVSLVEATDLAQRLCDAVRRPFSLRGSEVHVGTSVGIASSRTAGRSAGDLMKAADLAMYEAKEAGRGRCAVYHPRMHEQLAERVQLEADLRTAVEQGQFRVVYQPLVDLGSGGVSGVEALVRWHHPARGVVGPTAFIPLAESTGLIDAIGAFVLREACHQVATWRAEVPGAEAMRLSVNLSAHQLDDPHLVDLVTTTLRSSGLPATCLVLEVTESTLVHQHRSAVDTLDALRGLGVRLAIDDFGTGYSSLSYLHRLPVDIIKIDKSFVDRLSDSDDTSLVDAILSMASSLQLTTVAEGVEHEHQRSALAAQGCATGQGYHFSPPVEAHLVPGLVLSALLAQTGTDEAAPAVAPRAASPGS